MTDQTPEPYEGDPDDVPRVGANGTQDDVEEALDADD